MNYDPQKLRNFIPHENSYPYGMCTCSLHEGETDDVPSNVYILAEVKPRATSSLETSGTKVKNLPMQTATCGFLP